MFVFRLKRSTLQKGKCYITHRVPGEIKRREMELDPQVSPEEIMNRKVELGCKSWTSYALGCSSVAVQWTLSLWLPSTAAVSLVFFGWYPWSSLHSLALFPPVPVPNKQPHFCERKAKLSWRGSAGVLRDTAGCSTLMEHQARFFLESTAVYRNSRGITICLSTELSTHRKQIF